HHQDSPTAVLEDVFDEFGRNAGVEEKGTRLVDELAQAQPDDGDEEVADVSGRPHEARQKSARAIGPKLVNEGDAERPFAPHAERRDESQDADLPCRRRESTQARNEGIGEYGKHHRTHAAKTITE